MADNRIYLKCEGCGGLLYLGKRLGWEGYYWYNYGKTNNAFHGNDRGYTPQDERPLEDRLNEFFDKHTICGGSFDHFKIVYEMDDDFEWKSAEAQT